MTTETIEAAQRDHDAEVAHLADVDSTLTERYGELAAGEDEYKRLAYEFSRCENGAAEGVEASLQATREGRSRIKDAIGELKLVQKASQEEVDKKSLTLDLARHDKAAGECRELLKQKVVDAKKVVRALGALEKALAAFSLSDRTIYNLAHECGLEGERLNWLGNQKHVPKSLAASQVAYLGGLLESRPDRTFRETPLYVIEADRARVIEQDLDRARARILRTSGTPNGSTDNE